MFNLGFGEILIICAVLIIVVGPERLPGLMKNVGKTLRTVRQASRDLQATVGLDELMRDDITRPLPPPRPRIAPAATVPAAPVATLPESGTTPSGEPSSGGSVRAATSALSPAVSPVLPSATDDGSPSVEASTPAAQPPAPVAPSGEDYNKPADALRSDPLRAEADGLSVSERMLQLHTPPQSDTGEAHAHAEQGESPARAAGAAPSPPGGSKGEA